MSNSRPGRRRLAHDDGRVIRVTACCRLEIIISSTDIAARHDHGCPALNPRTPEGIRARLQANQAISRVITACGYGNTMAVMVTDA